ncbi:AraC family transcriptional regulator [Novosphingobium mangrovi (ex Huang et al. 2023)]|uniref:AraC family transcriptional regulator n=1 Tax=Novosphingobium mangrovi (ex Huang et al. 2023) TaxID=2976432 RepID=A0ABT2I9A6_9SPHN|nr:AraC family transcriptional regulator [Novosphingobium mangrovi (ex Huang et al. 2023)]MCT2401393.1 AraC family transcriptional regulator [Novosphingobium mangrovi (ex Huang et al. 2023)]
MLETALLEDGNGDPLLNGKLNESRDWAVVNGFCERTYMPLSTRPLVRGSDPDATIRMLKIGRIAFSRFCFGTPTRADDFDPSSGNIIVVNTLRGSVRHPVDGNTAFDTRAGDSYVVDCSRIDYWNIADGQDLQLNLTIPHALMEETAERWYGFVPEDDLWRKRLVFGKPQSAWLSLLDYAARSLDAHHDGIGDPLIEQRIEETICLELLRNWARAAGLSLDTGARAAAPRYVREAERLMTEGAAAAPSIAEIALKLGVSARSLSEGFRRFRGITPHAFLNARRLDGLRQALLAAAPGATVAAVARPLGYVNLSAMAASYQARFGEKPAQTLRGRRASI